VQRSPFTAASGVSKRGHQMDIETELNDKQRAYKAAVDKWIALIRDEEALASVPHSVAELDKWEQAHFAEDSARNEVKAAKRDYENVLRREFFGF
jgi:hypothetical protein